MRKMKCFEFTVSGSGDFPVDMLRDDAAFPAGPVGVDALELLFGDRALRGFGVVNVRLASMWQSPSVGRWASFGWTVSDVRKIS